MRLRAEHLHEAALRDAAGARDASLSAAADLFGQGSAEYGSVEAAWAAVNVA
ncbi:MAG TPA: M4 family metallopeptidase [Nocardioidaceae bacterium]|nr:M4 family metallopeptidase [Nocardioidaceae bacterium]